MGEAQASETLRTRRSLLAAAAGGAAALAVSTIRPQPAKAASTTVMTEVDNATAAPTTISNGDAGETAFGGHASGGGVGVEGTSASGEGVFGHSSDTSDPATNTRNSGVVGVAGDESAIAANIGLTGVYGYSDASPDSQFVGAGVWGDSPDVGVIGTGGTGALGDGTWGTVGVGRGATGIGLLGQVDNSTGRALRVEGRAEFTRSGRATVASGATKKVVTLAGCTTSTLVFAVMNTNESGRWVRAVVPAAGSFTVYFNSALTSSAAIVWIAFTNPSNHGG